MAITNSVKYVSKHKTTGSRQCELLRLPLEGMLANSMDGMLANPLQSYQWSAFLLRVQYNVGFANGRRLITVHVYNWVVRVKFLVTVIRNMTAESRFEPAA